MLFDPKWNVHRELRELHDWLASKNPDEEYDWTSCGGCAFGQFRTQNRWGWTSFATVAGSVWAYYHIGGGPDLLQRQWTFGKALERCREVIANPRRYRVRS